MPFFGTKRNRGLYTVAFYNLENFFDTKNDPLTLDDDFTTDGFKHWTPKRYAKKLRNLSQAIYRIGSEENRHPPVLVGLAEVENAKVLRDLIGSPALGKADYGFVHYDSPDERGIDTAMLYNKRFFEVVRSEPIPLMVYNTNGERDTTRDILYVHGKLNGEEIHLFVNHWPSRRQGDEETEYKRITAAETILQFMETHVANVFPNPNYVVMGDFNDGPTSPAITTLLDAGTLYNPMPKLMDGNRGTARYGRDWDLFDQIMVSHTFFNYERGTHSFAHANIFDGRLLRTWKGKFRGNPFRTFVGRTYQGGYSDHFPVYIELQYND